MQTLTPSELAQWLTYDPSTGQIFWKRKDHLPRCAGTEAGCISKKNGYRYIKVADKSYMAHRVAWALHYGAWPTKDLDHRDGTKANNRITNLREATESQNIMNSKLRKDNTSGHKGVNWHAQTGKWRAAVCLSPGVRKHLGYFDDLETAVAVRNKAALALHPEFARIA